jgi:CRISPR-associated RAMP protein (TIGR02581 family)
MIFQFTIEPIGPVLIKSGIEGGADPTIPDMNFVRTIHPETKETTVYLPGSSLKGTFRSYAEKITNTVGLKYVDVVAEPGAYEELKKKSNGADDIIYKNSCWVSKLFGSQIFASRIKFKDAFPEGEVKIENRTNVSINRILSKVQAGPFNIEVVTSGKFKGKIFLRNFELWQVGLLGLVFRDLSQEKVKIGYAKTRGLGDVKINLDEMQIDIFYSKPNYEKANMPHKVLGLDCLLPDEECQRYGIKVYGPLNLEIETTDPDGWGTHLHQKITDSNVTELFKECVQKQWAKLIEQEAQNAG